MDNRPIGIFDSGVGGITVAKEVMRHLPVEDIIYFGDTARVPYGSKSRETVTKFSKQIARFLIANDVKAIIVACNTVSSNCLEDLRSEFDIPLFGVVEPGVAAAVSATKNNRVGVIGTEATIRSGLYEKLIKAANSAAFVHQKACPLFVSLAEEGFFDGEITSLAVKYYIDELIADDIDTLVMGCTHYPLLADCIGKMAGGGITIVNPAAATALQTRAFLEDNNMLGDRQKGKPTFYVSDNTEKFNMLSEIVLGQGFEACKVDIEKY